MKLDGKVALVTGATSGIGKAVAELFLEEGARLVVNYHSEDEKRDNTEKELLEKLESGGRPASDLLMINCDISDPEEVSSMFSQIDQSLGSLDVLVNNAGMQKESASHELEPSSLQMQLGVDLLGPIYCSVEALKRFVSRGTEGVILNNSSVHQVIPKPGFLAYSASKGGLGNMTRTLALEYASRGIRVNSVCPGVVDTPINDELEDPETREETKSHVPQRSIIDSREIAKAFLYLASDDAKSVTGQSLVVDGGLTLYPSFESNWSSQ
ncbi:SDR family oxidoreductase [Pelagicoccus albus]|uniref:SDR family oxidoreductase n=1 Tax=Pelagicoccus albus TaxID=415222 RepID=A0A7X1E7U7_9BACT|nr:SDR family oxidoreductase [Pelagicoccus albus]MBC2606140.1 SDR family oxidoreductase [Pelagicoccus albus]